MKWPDFSMISCVVSGEGQKAHQGHRVRVTLSRTSHRTGSVCHAVTRASVAARPLIGAECCQDVSTSPTTPCPGGAPSAADRGWVGERAERAERATPVLIPGCSGFRQAGAATGRHGATMGLTQTIDDLPAAEKTHSHAPRAAACTTRGLDRRPPPRPTRCDIPAAV